jgi:hypothetical protein
VVKPYAAALVSLIPAAKVFAPADLESDPTIKRAEGSNICTEPAFPGATCSSETANPQKIRLNATTNTNAAFFMASSSFFQKCRQQ